MHPISTATSDTDFISDTDSCSATSGIAPRPLALSASRANDFKQCPLLYRFRAIDKLPEQPSKEQFFGTAVHAALEQLFALPRHSRHLAKAQELAINNIQSMFGSLDANIFKQSDLNKFIEKSSSVLEQYYQLENPLQFDSQERELLMEVNYQGVLLRGYVDRIDLAHNGMVRIVDYKTGRSPGPGYEAKALFQMKFYALLHRQIKGELPDVLRLLYLGDRQIVEYIPESTEIDRFGLQLLSLWQAIETAGSTGNFPAKKSGLCKWCSHQNFCPSFGGLPPQYPGWPAPSSVSQH